MRILSIATSLLLIFSSVIMPGTSNADFFISVTIAPPALPVYVPPPPPDPAYFWAPGYWAYDPSFEDYYWVPGTWVPAPAPGLLWTPGYWGWNDGNYIFNEGYWGPHIGFYGGINYGYGYSGSGYWGGRWNNGVFVNAYSRGNWKNGNSDGNWKNGHSAGMNTTNSSTNNSTTSFNGGPGGIKARATPAERAVMKEKHIPATAAQKLQMQAARKNPALRASVNHGKPAIAATAKPGVFKGKGVVAAKKAGSVYKNIKPIKSKKIDGKKAEAMPKRPGEGQHKDLSHAKSKPKVKKPAVKRPHPKLPVRRPLPKVEKPKPDQNGDTGY